MHQESRDTRVSGSLEIPGFPAHSRFPGFRLTRDSQVSGPFFRKNVNFFIVKKPGKYSEKKNEKPQVQLVRLFFFEFFFKIIEKFDDFFQKGSKTDLLVIFS